MRPVQKGTSPIVGDFAAYDDAAPDLLSRLGHYCSYCERQYYSVLAVEHIQPKKGKHGHPSLERRWSNFLLACINCNSTKGHKKVELNKVLLPDRDNTYRAYEYHPDGTITVSAVLPKKIADMAKKTLTLTGLQKPRRMVKDSNGKVVAMDRIADRAEQYGKAAQALIDVKLQPTDVSRRLAAGQAFSAGFFSVWMKVFEGDPAMQQLLINGFPNTVDECCKTPYKKHPGNSELSPRGRL